MSTINQENIEQIILNSINEGVITIDCAGNVILANPSAARILGIQAPELISRNYESFLLDEKNTAMKKILSRLVEEGIQTSHSEITYIRPDGQTIFVAISASALQIDSCFEGLETFVVVLRDITAFKALEKVRKKAVNHLAHELATPLSVIHASVNSLKQDQNWTEKSQRHLARLERNLDRLLNIESIVEQILYPRNFYPAEFQLKELLDKIVTKIKYDSSHRKVDFRYPDLDVVFHYTDPAIFEIIILTLVKNAVENTPDGGLVELLITMEQSRSVIAVRDYGVGIPLEDQSFIFEGFHHTQDTEDYATRKPYDFNAGGKGLELLRLKALSEGHGFDVSFESSRCKYIPLAIDRCPGNIEECPHVKSREECYASGGSTFYVNFEQGD